MTCITVRVSKEGVSGKKEGLGIKADRTGSVTGSRNNLEKLGDERIVLRESGWKFKGRDGGEMMGRFMSILI